MASVVWSTLANNPYYESIIDVARARGGWGEPIPQMVRAFSLGNAEEYRRALIAAGFREVAAHPVRSAKRYRSIRETLDAMQASPLQSEPIDRLPQEQQADAWAEVEAKLRGFEREGAWEFPLESLVLVGVK